ncbi:outer membrane beta-barrel protein [Psychromonas sp. KJ10-10]|uniref:outer membrane beta-barrel protein n=1 Tax=Psychromonas sp. KJ10-10 TaxID=3391823 RepID=UPI0039B59E0E
MSKLNYLLPIALLASASSYATDEDTWYAGARLGATTYSDFTAKNFTVTGLDNDDWGGDFFLGYNVNDWFALETGFTYLGQAEFNTTGELDQQALDVVGKFTKGINESFDLFAKAGVSYYMSDLGTNSDENLILTAGVGAEYFFTKNVSARLEYQFYNDASLNGTSFNADWDTHFYGASIVYTFGASKTPAPVPAPVVVAPVVEPVVVAPVVEKKPDPVVIEPLTVRIRFATESAVIEQKYFDELAPIAQHLIDYPEAKLFVVGHTDSMGARDYNQDLSERRAATCCNSLI